jgi:S-adenosylmethionine-diacylglycerol 3-amino-3-carboxypropyl transferase
LQEEWELLLRNSVAGSKVMMRSAGAEVDFIPHQARSAVRFFPELTETLHRQDRVGTYGSLHLAEVM